MLKQWSVRCLGALLAVFVLLAAGCSLPFAGEGAPTQGHGALSPFLPSEALESAVLYAYGEAYPLAQEDFPALLAHLGRRIPAKPGEGAPFSGEEIEGLKRDGRLLALQGAGTTLLFPLSGGMDDRFSVDGAVYTGLSPEASAFLPAPNRAVLYHEGETTVLIGKALAEAMEQIQRRIPDTLSAAALAFDPAELTDLTGQSSCIELFYDPPAEFCYLSMRKINRREVASLLFPLEGKYANAFWDGKNWLGGLRDLYPVFKEAQDPSPPDASQDN